VVGILAGQVVGGVAVPVGVFRPRLQGDAVEDSLSTRLRALRNFVTVATGRPGSLLHVAFYACGVRTLTPRVDVNLIH
jgi:hypothetical protein